MDIETALRQQFIVFPCQADAFTRQKERGNGTRVFTFESPKFRPGSRKFLATSVAKFWHWYEQCRVPRHFYELIQEGTPCRPYFDLEYYREFNQHLDAHETLFAFLHLCREVFADELGETLTNRSFLLLDSSTDTKFSVHVTVHLPDGKLFPNNVILKALVDRICSKMSETGVGIVRTEDKDTFLCDTGVYSKNRNFRLYLSSKCGKDAVLRFADYCDFYGGKKAPDWRIFLDSLVVPNDYEKFEHLDLSALVSTLPRTSLRCSTNTSNNVQRLPLEAYSLRRNDFVDEVAKGNGSSPFSALDRHILTFLGRFSPNVGIRQWQLQIARTTNSRRLQYELVNCRYCFSIERQHKSQNVYWVVDLERFCYFQKCFDIECRKFISNRFPLPENVVKAVKPRVVSVFTFYKRNSMDDSVEDRRLVGWLQNESRRRSSLLASPQALPVLQEDSFNDSRRDRSLAAHLERRSTSRKRRSSAGPQIDSSYNDVDLEYLVDKVAKRPDADSFYDLRSDEKFKQFRRSALAKKILTRDDSFDNTENDYALAAALVDYAPSCTSNSVALLARDARKMTQPSDVPPTKLDSKQTDNRRGRTNRRRTQDISIVEETAPSSPIRQSNARSQRLSPQILDESLQIETSPYVLAVVKKAAAATPHRGSKRKSVEVVLESPVSEASAPSTRLTACPPITPKKVPSLVVKKSRRSRSKQQPTPGTTNVRGVRRNR